MDQPLVTVATAWEPRGGAPFPALTPPTCVVASGGFASSEQQVLLGQAGQSRRSQPGDGHCLLGGRGLRQSPPVFSGRDGHDRVRAADTSRGVEDSHPRKIASCLVNKKRPVLSARKGRMQSPAGSLRALGLARAESSCREI
jgi:hypothetical protein